MSNTENCDHAFPCPAGCGTDQGMTLRDYFAAKALQGMVSQTETAYAQICQNAYIFADLMLKAREKKYV